MKRNRNGREMLLKIACLVVPVAAVFALGFLALFTHALGIVWSCAAMFGPPSKTKIFAPRILVGCLLGLATFWFFLTTAFLSH